VIYLSLEDLLTQATETNKMYTARDQVQSCWIQPKDHA